MISAPHQVSTTGWPTDRLLRGAYWLLAAIVLANLNGVGRMGLGIDQGFSLIMLACCLFLMGVSNIDFRKALGPMGMLFVASIGSYLFIGTIVGLATGADVRHGVFSYFVSYFNSLLIIVAVAVGTLEVLRRIDSETLLTIILVILFVDTLAILASPLLRDLYVLPPSTSAFRLTGTFGNPNQAGLVGCMTAVLALSFIAAGRRRLLAYVALVTACTATVGSFSKTSMLTLGVVFAWYLTAWGGFARRRILGWIGLMTLAVLLATMTTDLKRIALHPGQIARLDAVISILSGDRLDNTLLTGRLRLWSLAGREIVESPVVGVGLGRMHEIEGAPIGSQGERLGAHNEYLVLLGEAGIIPLILFLAFLGFAIQFRWIARRSLEQDAVTGWAIVIATACMTSHNILTMRFCVFLIGVSCALAFGIAESKTKGAH